MNSATLQTPEVGKLLPSSLPPGVSVVIPAYNYAHYLPRAIDSVLAQTYPNVEIVVVDDGSTDNTADVAAGYGDKIRYIYQKNAGLSAARNAGTRAASHPYVAYLDADDEFYSEMIGYLMKVFTHLPAEFGLVACACDKMTDDGVIIRRKQLEDLSPRVVEFGDLVTKNRFVADALVARKDRVLEVGGFDTDLSSSEDRDMWVRMSCHCKLYLVPRKLVKVRVHENSMSTHATRMKQNMLKVIAKSRKLVRKPVTFWARAYAFLYFQTACMYHNRRATLAALRDLLTSIAYWPWFVNPYKLNENFLFRVRSGRRFLMAGLSGEESIERIERHDVFTSPLSLGGGSGPDGEHRFVEATAPGISVIVPAYNYAHFLGNAIDSVLAQDYPVKEVIIVDDGSTDGTAELAATYGDRVRYIYKENGGLSAARNTGLQAARMPFVAFLDADDEWMPGMLSRLMKTMLSLPESFGVVACQYFPMDSSAKLQHCKQLVRDLPKELFARDIVLKTRFSPSAALVRRQVFEHCGDFDTNLRSSEDRDMWARIARRFRIFQIEDNLTFIRNHPNSMSKHSDRMKRNMRVVVRKGLKELTSGPMFRLKVFSFLHYQTAWMYFDEGRRAAAVLELFRSILLWPYFTQSNSLNEPVLFRFRSLIRFLFYARESREMQYQRQPL